MSINSCEINNKFNCGIKAMCPVCGKIVDMKISDSSTIKIDSHEEDLKLIISRPVTSHYLFYCHERLMIDCRDSIELEFCKLLFDIGCYMKEVFFTNLPTEINTLYGIGRYTDSWHDVVVQYNEPLISFSPTSDANGITYEIIYGILNSILFNEAYSKISVYTYDPENEYDDAEFDVSEYFDPYYDAKYDRRQINISFKLKDRSNFEEYRACMNAFSKFYMEFARRIKEVLNNG